MRPITTTCYVCGRRLFGKSEFAIGVCTVCASEANMKPSKITIPAKGRKPKNPCRPQSKSCDAPATKSDLEKLGRKIMSAVTDQLKALEGKVTGIGEDVDTVVTSIGGITTDVAQLKADIERLQNSQGTTWTPDDQIIADRMQATINALSAKTKAAAETAKALDEATAQPPTEPTEQA